jgi:hypothetical protein
MDDQIGVAFEKFRESWLSSVQEEQPLRLNSVGALP